MNISFKLLLGLALLRLAPVWAQTDDPVEKIETAKIALINERLGLNPEQAERFWPLYNEYAKQRQELMREFRTSREGLGERQLSEAESKALIERGMRLKERQLDIDRRYGERLNQVITNRQLLELRRAEEDFRNMLLKRLEQRSQQMERREMIQNKLDKRKNE
ncbi:MAG: hypothetical protein HC842_01195 [Cytophagales bacterium]|nr:hypothetical protein [Cytophagales bacterium]